MTGRPPTLSLRLRAAVLAGSMGLVLSAILGAVAVDVAKTRATQDAGSELADTATRMLDTLDRGMFERYREIQIAASLDDLRSPLVPSESKRALLERLQSSFDGYAWLGIADPGGHIAVGTGGTLEGHSVAARPWFRAGRQAPYVGDVQNGDGSEAASGTHPYRLAVATPVRGRDGALVGVLAGQIFWRWADEVLGNLPGNGVDVFLIARDGTVLAGPPTALHKSFAGNAPDIEAEIDRVGRGYVTATWSDGRDVVAGFATARGYRDYPGLGWRIVLREDTATVLASVGRIREQLLAAGLLLSLLFAGLGWLLAGRIARPVAAIATAVEEIGSGKLEQELPTFPGRDELGRLSVSLRDLVRKLTTEIVGRNEAEQSLRLVSQVFESSSEGIMITDAHNRIVAVNPAFTRITGYPPEAALGRNPRMLKSGRQGPAFYEAMWKSLKADGRWEGEIWNRTRDGEVLAEWLRLSVVRDEGGRIRNHIAVFSPLMQPDGSREKIEHLASHDPLTGLPNRHLLQDRLEQALLHAQRTGTRLGVLFIDLDRFKAVNDSLGHEIGDKLLDRFAQRLRESLRSDDGLGRYGSDEFIATIPDVAGESEVIDAVERILHQMERPFAIDGYALSITPSIGISLYPNDGTDMRELIRNADLAMIRAKESGRNAYQFFTPEMNDRASKRMQVEIILREAIEGRQGRFEVVYQPRAEVDSGRIVGVEALLRCHHPSRGLILPSEFIPVAEDTGLIGPIGEWVLRQSCRQGRDWVNRGLPALKIAVNVSLKQFHQKNFVDTVARIVSEAGYPASCIELEVTESIFSDDREATLCTLRELRALGIELAIDDFGTGYSSLSYLQQMPIDYLKIDQSFVRDIATNRNNRQIVSAIVVLGHDLGLRVIAEGVGDEDCVAALLEEGCDQFQGYHLSRPQRPEIVEDLVRNGRRAA